MESDENTGSDVDRRALKALFDCTQGPTWAKNRGWVATEGDNSSDYSKWAGIHVDKEKRVMRLNMFQNRMKGALPPEIWQLDQLVEIFMSCNSLAGPFPVPGEGVRLEKLKTLNLDRCKLEGPFPCLHHLPNLTKLFLGNNQLSGQLLSQLDNCTSLSKLSLESNAALTGPIPTSFSMLRCLWEFQLYGTNMTGGVEGYLKQPEGEEADINFSGGVSPELCCSIPNLETVRLANCKLSGRIPQEICRLINLKVLSLNGNNLTGTVPATMATMTTLKELRLTGNSELTIPADARYHRSLFYKWTQREGFDHDLASLPVASAADEEDDDEKVAFLLKAEVNILSETPMTRKVQDCLDFHDYADVLVEHVLEPTAWPVAVGIYAQWGAGKSSLLGLILRRLQASGDDDRRRTCWQHFSREWLQNSSVGTVAQGLWAVCCGSRKDRGQSEDEDDEESLLLGLETTEDNDGAGASSSPDITCIVASFDAWLSADSDVLWAVLISEIFDQVESHPSFGKGAVRATRVRAALEESSCMDWMIAFLIVVLVTGVVVAIVLVGREIDDLDSALKQALAVVALAGVPLSLIVGVVKALPVVFKAPGERILKEARSGTESVGSSHLGFMAEVQAEMKDLLGMMKAKCTADHKYVLVVSIDNLDRCSQSKIVKVLEAVHLLLEQDRANVVVLLALDPRVIIAAIEADMNEGTLQAVSGAEYLDKIVHWPFCIPFGATSNRLRLMHKWLRTPEDVAPAQVVVDSDGAENGGHPGCDATADTLVAAPATTVPIFPATTGSAAPQSSSVSFRSILPQTSSAAIELVGPQRSSPALLRRTSSVANVARDGESTALLDGHGSTSAVPLTSGEVEEFEMLMKTVVATPRKSKRVLNVYSIQRSLATRKITRFTQKSARKLLRWTILSEFWPFRAACLIGCVNMALFAIHDKEATMAGSTAQQAVGDELRTPTDVTTFDTLIAVYSGVVARTITEMTRGTKREQDSSVILAVPDEGYSWTAARRLLGMDESDEAFIHVLGSEPLLSVGDFTEEKLGLSRLSFNLNPAMVAQVSAWTRSRW